VSRPRPALLHQGSTELIVIPRPPADDWRYAYDEPAPAVPPAPAADPIEQLKQLGALHQQGVLTDEEFAAQKAKQLG
jgi:hypothetical protein